MYHLFGVELQHVLMVVLPARLHLVVAGEEAVQALKANYEGKAGDGDAEVGGCRCCEPLCFARVLMTHAQHATSG